MTDVRSLLNCARMPAGSWRRSSWALARMNSRAALTKPRRRAVSVTKRLSEDNVDRLAVSADREVAVVGIDLDHGAAGFQRLVRLPVAREPFADHPVGSGEHGVNVSERVGEVVEDIASGFLPHRLRRRTQGLGDGGDRWQRFVVDHDEFQAILGGVARLGDHQRNEVADVAYLVGAHRRKGRVVQTGQHEERRERAGKPRDVGTGEHRDDSGRPLRRRDLNALDAGMGEWATKKRRVENPRRVDVGDVAAPTREESVVLDPRDALSDESRQARWRVHVPAPSDLVASSRTAISTPSMID